MKRPEHAPLESSTLRKALGAAPRHIFRHLPNRFMLPAMEVVSLLVGFVLGVAAMFSPALIASYFNLGWLWVFYLIPLAVLLTNANLRNVQFAVNVAQREGAASAVGQVAFRLLSVATASVALNSLAYFAISWSLGY